MADRIFDIANVQYGDTKRPTITIHCGHPGCENAETMRFTSSRAPNRSFVCRNFTNKGWKVGKKPGQDRCPEHAHAARSIREEHAEMETKQVAAEPPREMSRDDRRIIFAKLDEVYIGGQGYDAPWTDAKVADDLGVPPAWVTEVRVDFFGDEDTNPEINEFVKLSAELTEAVTKLREDMHRYALAQGKLTSRMSSIEGQLELVTALRKKIEKETARGGRK